MSFLPTFPWASPRPKPNDSPAPAPDPVPAMSSSRLGAKRKSKVDPYEDMDPEDEMQKTPSSQRANSRNSSSTPSTRPKSNTKLARKTRTPGSIIAATSVTRASPAVPKQRNEITAIIENVKNQITAEPREEISRVMEAPMMGDGDAIIALNDEMIVAAGESGGEASDVDLGTVRVERTTEESEEEEEEEDSEEPEADAGAADEEEEKEEEEEAETAEEVEEEEGEVHELKALLKHRSTPDGVELLVHWAGETIDEATWEPEEEIQRGADEMLYEYWGKKKGRSAALFTGRKGAPPEEYHVFKVLNHDKKPKNGGFSMEVQWVGYSATALDTTWEPESKLRKIAPTLLDEYWDGLGGRDNFLGKRGRGKRARLS